MHPNLEEVLEIHRNHLKRLNETGENDIKQIAMQSANIFTNSLKRMDDKTQKAWLGYILECIDSDLSEIALNQTSEILDERLKIGHW